jgi:hypothetical protein
VAAPTVGAVGPDAHPTIEPEASALSHSIVRDRALAAMPRQRPLTAHVDATAASAQAASCRGATEVNYLGFLHGTLAALKRMRPRNRGTIVQVGSALAFRGIPLQSPYCATKHAIVGFTESLNAELLAEGSDVAVCVVHLPGLNTTQFVWGRNKLPKAPQPVPPIFQPEVAAEAIAWAADNGRRVTYVGANTVLTVWGTARGAADGPLPRANEHRRAADRPARRPARAGQPVRAAGPGRRPRLSRPLRRARPRCCPATEVSSPPASSPSERSWSPGDAAGDVATDRRPRDGAPKAGRRTATRV